MIENDERNKRGGQPGNQNARTHGFYSKALTPKEQGALRAAASISGLDYEIALLRTKILSILANDPNNHTVLLLAITALTRTLKTKHQILKNTPEETAKAIKNVLRQVALPLGLEHLMQKIIPDSPAQSGEAKPDDAGGETAHG